VELLFVYGTLLTAIKHPVGENLRSSADFVGNGQVSGMLYDIGEYPGLVTGDETGRKVFGEVYDLSRCTELWLEIDEYEGLNDSITQEYTREKVMVKTANATLSCWTYIYQGMTDNLIPIKGGDYLSYCKKK
jgi:gamma-glutamylcyclotransferase (GGCT)/AIG2-like uncharacterized protein YtfP